MMFLEPEDGDATTEASREFELEAVTHRCHSDSSQLRCEDSPLKRNV